VHSKLVSLNKDRSWPHGLVSKASYWPVTWRETVRRCQDELLINEASTTGPGDVGPFTVTYRGLEQWIGCLSTIFVAYIISHLFYKKCENISIHGSIALVDLSRFLFLYLYTVGSTPWREDQPVAKPLPTHRTTQTQNKWTHSYFECYSNPRPQCSSGWRRYMP
jgi:hypothetical protein